jgi:hypothetical protein
VGGLEAQSSRLVCQTLTNSPTSGPRIRPTMTVGYLPRLSLRSIQMRWFDQQKSRSVSTPGAFVMEKPAVRVRSSPRSLACTFAPSTGTGAQVARTIEDDLYNYIDILYNTEHGKDGGQ